MKFYFSFLVFWCLAANCNGVIVDTKLGKIEGFLSKSQNGSPISNFMGIPFGKPPVGPLRFKKPEPAEPWTGTLQAKSTVQCTQYDRFFKHGVIGQEDCLVLNVYVPSKPRGDQDLLPVMFFIHGGAFFMGSGSPDFYGPERFLDYDVILVTTNYRLGALGFMSTSNDDMPGNLGLWDQNLALKWVQENIRKFGGDPNKVTIFGESAGAMSVIFQYLSPHSHGLFQGAIAQSGVATSTFLKVDKNPIYYARSVASKVGCNPEASTSDLVKCLQEVDGDILQGYTMLFPQMEFYPLVFKPYIDDYTSDPFVPKDPWELIESGEFQHVPLIVGNNQDEGLLSAFVFYNNHSLVDQLTERWENELGPLYLFGRELDDVDPEVVQLTREVSQFAFPEDLRPTKETIMTGYKDLISDVVFNAVGSITARKIAQKSKSNVYEYLYKHRGTMGLSDLIKMKWWKIVLKFFGQIVGLNLFCPEHGVGHADELFMMFKTQKIPIEGVFTDSDKATSQNLLRLWTDFAKTGNPTPDSKEWTRLTDSTKARMEIGSGTLEMNLDETLEHRLEFWTKIWEKLPTKQRFQTSKTWSNPILYGPTNAINVGRKETKDEL